MRPLVLDLFILVAPRFDMLMKFIIWHQIACWFFIGTAHFFPVISTCPILGFDAGFAAMEDFRNLLQAWLQVTHDFLVAPYHHRRPRLFSPQRIHHGPTAAPPILWRLSPIISYIIYSISPYIYMVLLYKRVSWVNYILYYIYIYILIVIDTNNRYIYILLYHQPVLLLPPTNICIYIYI